MLILKTGSLGTRKSVVELVCRQIFESCITRLFRASETEAEDRILRKHNEWTIVRHSRLSSIYKRFENVKLRRMHRI